MEKIILNYLLMLIAALVWSLQTFAQPNVILVKDNSFSPSTLTIQEGDDVIFKLQGSGGIHPVIADNNTDWADFTLNASGEEKVISSLSIGSHGYHCLNHGNPGSFMFGTIIVTGTTGTKSNKISMNGLTIAPNPFDGMVNLNLEENHKDLTEIRITDIIGNEVTTVNLNSKMSSYNIDLSSLRSGIYFFNLHSSKGIIETRKLIKTH